MTMTFQGNQSRQFLNLIDKLELELMGQTKDAIVNGLPYIHTFRAFDQVVSTSFGVDLKEGYQEAISKFRVAYFNLGITVTHKVFILVIQK